MKKMSQNGTAASPMAENMGRVGLGYGIAIAVGILVLVSTIMLASYVCVRVHGRGMVPTGGTASAAAGGRIVGDEGGGAVGPGGGGNDESNGNETPGEWVIGGLDQATLESYPKVVYGEKLQQQLKQEDDGSCSICLADYRRGELLRLLPDCHHAFHVPCIDAWLRLHASCPMCRTSPLPTPQSTPLSELIPLARQPLQSRYTTRY